MKLIPLLVLEKCSDIVRELGVLYVLMQACNYHSISVDRSTQMDNIDIDIVLHHAKFTDLTCHGWFKLGHENHVDMSQSALTLHFHEMSFRRVRRGRWLTSNYVADAGFILDLSLKLFSAH